MKFAAVLLDMDDTVLVHEKLADELWDETVRGVLSNRSKVEQDFVVAAVLRERHALWTNPTEAKVGRLDMHAARRLFVGRALEGELATTKQPELIEELVAEFSRARDASVVFPQSSRDALVQLRSDGRKLALITNGEGVAQRRKVQRFNLESYVDSVFIEGELGVGKPEWTIYDVALQNLSVGPADAVMIGDNWEWEVVIPGNHGLASIWVRRFGDPAPANPARRFLGTVRQVSEVIELLNATERAS
jgi:putative hydrolase of the HAD superfamily